MRNSKSFIPLVILVAALSICFTAHGSKRAINGLKDKISNQTNDINKLAAQIQDLESTISTTNESYLTSIKAIDIIEAKVSEMKSDLTESAEKISKEYNHTKLAFDHYLLEITDSDSDDALLVGKVYLDVLKTKLTNLNRVQTKSNTLLNTISIYEQKLSAKKYDENSIYNLIVDLENKKKDFAKNYVSTVENKNTNQSRLDRLLAKKHAKAKLAKRKKYSKSQSKRSRAKKRSKAKVAKQDTKVLFKLGLPIDNFIDAKNSKEGVSFKYSQTMPIKAPKAGKIVYAGELASYGKVLIIDHGQDVRSVLLGDIASKVKKGDTVKAQQIIGYTLTDPGVTKSLYYEVRKKNIAQNTSRWLVKTELSKKKHKI